MGKDNNGTQKCPICGEDGFKRVGQHIALGHPDETPWRDAEVLRELYHGEKMTTKEIGDELGCSKPCVRANMDDLGIERRSGDELYTLRDPAAQHFFNVEGYEMVANEYKGKKKSAMVHSLILIAGGADPHKVFSDDWHVHHKNGRRFDNRESNLALLTSEEHGRISQRTQPQEIPVDEDEFREVWFSDRTIPEIEDYYDMEPIPVNPRKWAKKIHLPDKWDTRPWATPQLLEYLYWERELRQAEIAEKLGCSRGTITYQMEKHDIPKRKKGEWTYENHGNLKQ